MYGSTTNNNNNNTGTTPKNATATTTTIMQKTTTTNTTITVDSSSIPRIPRVFNCLIYFKINYFHVKTPLLCVFDAVFRLNSGGDLSAQHTCRRM
jgi:hypothetical protein